MISKDKALEQIKSKTDIPVNLTDGSIIFSYDPDNVPNLDKFRKTASDLIKDVGYKASWGIISVKKAAPTENDSTTPDHAEDDVIEDIPVDEPENDPMIAVHVIEEEPEEKQETSHFFTEDEGGQMSLF